MSNEIASWIIEAVRETKIQVDELDPQQARLVYEKAKNHYVDGNPRSWWMSLKCDPEVLQNRDAALASLHQISIEEMCYFIPETESDPLVFRLRLKDVATLVDNCPYFEYYIVGKDLGWLIIESDHNEFFVVNSS